MVDIAKVKLYGMDIGTFRWNEKYGLAQFEYTDNFVGKDIEPAPLMMPVRSGRVYSFGDIGKETFKGLPGMLADSLPDTYGRALFEAGWPHIAADCGVPAKMIKAIQTEFKLNL